MHELAICQSLVGQLNAISSEHQGHHIVTIHLQIGPLSGVEPQLLRDAFPIASAGTAADGAVLEIHECPIEVHCEQCGKDTLATVSNLACQHCGDWQTQVITGDELMLARVEMDTDQQSTRVH